MKPVLEKALASISQQLDSSADPMVTDIVNVIALLVDEIKALEKRLSSVERTIEVEEDYRREQMEH